MSIVLPDGFETIEGDEPLRVAEIPLPGGDHSHYLVAVHRGPSTGLKAEMEQTTVWAVRKMTRFLVDTFGDIMLDNGQTYSEVVEAGVRGAAEELRHPSVEYLSYCPVERKSMALESGRYTAETFDRDFETVRSGLVSIHRSIALRNRTTIDRFGLEEAASDPTFN